VNGFLIYQVFVCNVVVGVQQVDVLPSISGVSIPIIRHDITYARSMDLSLTRQVDMARYVQA
jgi:hypothetical protein